MLASVSAPGSGRQGRSRMPSRRLARPLARALPTRLDDQNGQESEPTAKLGRTAF
jgi:hypothetical protein